LFRLTIRAHRGRLRRTAAPPPPAWARRAVGSRGRPHRRIRRCVSRNRRLGRPLGIRGRRAAAALGGCRPIARGTLLDGDAGRCVTRVQARLLLLAGGNRRRFLSVRRPTLAPATKRGKRDAIRPLGVCRATQRSAGGTPSPAQPNDA
jgi:hypothetical protein